jgi:ADP-ribose pyrophosphatase YjhB (NUDIX family)
MRTEHEYERKGVLTYHAALDVQTGRVLGAFPERNTSEAFRGFVDRVMRTPRYRSARRVYWILDNGSAHDPRSFVKWLRGRHPKARAIYLPTHSSWLNQIEVYFGIVQLKALTPSDFPSHEALRQRLEGFQEYYNLRAHPFDWRFTRADLTHLLQRLAQNSKAANIVAVSGRPEGVCPAELDLSTEGACRQEVEEGMS